MPRLRPPDGQRSPQASSAHARLRLLGGFALESDERLLAVPHAAQRPVAMLALQSRPLLRGYVAGQLWPEASEERAAGNLRSALWRLRRAGFEGVERQGDSITLAPWVSVDARELAERASSLTRHCVAGELAGVDGTQASGAFVGELLPDWYDDWVLIERERLRQLGLHALEAMAAGFTRAERFGEAVDAALLAIRIEPYRESAHRALIRAHLAEGNVHEAIRQYQMFRTMIERELGVEPSFQIEALIATATTPARTDA